jgi:hypothetical protein
LIILDLFIGIMLIIFFVCTIVFWGFAVAEPGQGFSFYAIGSTLIFIGLLYAAKVRGVSKGLWNQIGRGL